MSTNPTDAQAVAIPVDLPVGRLVPERVQLSRTKGWRMPPNTVNVARPTKWGNPYRWQDYELRDCDVPWDVDAREFATRLAVDAFEEDAKGGKVPDIAALRGKHLACWCKRGQPCHADVLLRLANSEPPNVAIKPRRQASA